MATTERVLVGDEVSRASTAIHQLQLVAYDLYTRGDYHAAIGAYEVIAEHARNAQHALLAEKLEREGQTDLAREAARLITPVVV